MLSKEKLDEIKNRLSREKLQILSDIFGEEMAIKYFVNSSEGDLVDKASDFYESQLLASISGIQREIIDQINEALRRIEDGTYGKCKLCGAEIEEERIDAIPYTDMCSACARKQVKR